MAEPRSTLTETLKAPAPEGRGASKAEQAVRQAPDAAVCPQEKRAIGAETSREEDA